MIRGNPVNGGERGKESSLCWLLRAQQAAARPGAPPPCLTRPRSRGEVSKQVG